MSKQDIPSKLLWVDLEMTGLEPEKQRIIEVAIVVTDFSFSEVARYESVIHQPEPVLANAEPWCKENLADLFEQVRRAEKNESTVVDEIVQFIEDNFGDEPAVLAGNSIHQDRRFIRQWWPRIEAKLHYRMFDVSSFKIWLQGAHAQQFEKTEQHRALGDIEESIEELKWCLSQLSGRE